MSRPVSKLLLWLLVINLGIAFGAGLYESRIVFPRWLETAYFWNAEVARADDTGLRFWIYVTTGPLTLITFANLVAAWRHRGDARSWWLGSCIVAMVERAFTFSYFIPTMIALTGNGILPSEAADEARRWELLNYLRHAIVLVAWLLALKAFGALHREGRVLI